MANELTFPRFKAIDGNGNPIRGGKLYTYVEGTSTDKSVYSDSARTVAHANPVILSSEGEALIYLKGAYKMNLTTSADAQVPGWPVDNIGPVSGELAQGFYPNSGAADHGLTGDSDTVKYRVDTIGSTNKATLYFRHDSGNEFTDYTFATSETITSNITLEFEPGARLSINNAITVTIQGTIKDTDAQIISGTGVVSFGANMPMKDFKLVWWGVIPDGSTDSSTPLKAAETAMDTLTRKATLIFPRGDILANTITGSVNTTREGVGLGMTRILYNGAGGAGSTIYTFTTTLSQGGFRGMSLLGFAGTVGNEIADNLITITSQMDFPARFEHVQFGQCFDNAVEITNLTGGRFDWCRWDSVGGHCIKIVASITHENRPL